MTPAGLDQQAEHNHQAEWVKRPERSNMLMLRVMSWISLTLGRPLSRGCWWGSSLYFLLFFARAREASRGLSAGARSGGCRVSPSSFAIS